MSSTREKNPVMGGAPRGIRKDRKAVVFSVGQARPSEAAQR